jgi:hypothetical protein
MALHFSSSRIGVPCSLSKIDGKIFSAILKIKISFKPFYLAHFVINKHIKMGIKGFMINLFFKMCTIFLSIKSLQSCCHFIRHTCVISHKMERRFKQPVIIENFK